MGKDIKDIKTNDSCSHSDGKGLPVCWDCAEEGHVKQRSAGEGPLSPTWESLRKIKKGLLFQQSSSKGGEPAGAQSSAPEVHPPEEGIEVGVPGVRESQPGLEVVFGPRIVSPEDKLRRVVVGKNVHATAEQKEAEAEAEAEGSRDRGARIYGLRKRTFWVVVACALLVLVAVILGVVIGVTQRNRAMQSTALSMSSGGDQVSSLSSSISPSMPSVTTETMYMASTPVASPPEGGSEDASAESPADTTPSQPQTTPAIAPSSSSPSSNTDTDPNPEAATPSPSPSPSSSSDSSSPRPCFAPDDSTYRDPWTGAGFRVSCGASLAGKDIENPEAESMEACVGLCAADDACRGAVWYSAGPQGTDLNYCWLKSEMEEEGKGRKTEDAQSVVRL